MWAKLHDETFRSVKSWGSNPHQPPPECATVSSRRTSARMPHRNRTDTSRRPAAPYEYTSESLMKVSTVARKTGSCELLETHSDIYTRRTIKNAVTSVRNAGG